MSMALTDTLASMLARIRTKKIEESFWGIRCITEARNVDTCSPGLVTKLSTYFGINLPFVPGKYGGLWHNRRKRQNVKTSLGAQR